MKNKRLIKLWLVIGTILIFIICISCLLSLEWNNFQKQNVINHTILSEYLAAFGTIATVIIALFSSSIQRWLEKTDVIIEDNRKFDKNFAIDDHSSYVIITYFLHLKVVNTNTKTTIQDCIISLQPQKIDDHTLDSPRHFFYAGSKDTKRNISHEDFIDLVFIEIELSDSIKDGKLNAKLILQVHHHKIIDVDLLKNETTSFTIMVYSVSLNSVPEFKITLKIKQSNWIEFTKYLISEGKKRIDYNEGIQNTLEHIASHADRMNMSTNRLKGLGTEQKLEKINDFYDCITVRIEKI